MAKSKTLKMKTKRSGVTGKLVLSNTFPRKTNPKTGTRMEVFVCKGGVLLREDGVQLRRSDGKPSKNPRKNPEVITVNIGDDLRDVPERNNLPDCFKWQYEHVCYYCG